MKNIYSKLLWVLSAAILVYARYYPQSLMGSIPIGTDSSNTYISAYLNYQGSLLSSLKSFDLMYWIFSVERHFGVDAMAGIRITGIILLPLLGLAFGLVLKDKLKFPSWLAALGSLAYGLQISTMRISWDLYRNELSLILALLAIWFTSFVVKENKYRVLWAVLAVTFGAVAILTHQIAGLLFLAYLVISIVLWAMQKVIKSQLALITIAILVAVGWVYVSQYLSRSGMSLWIPNDHLNTNGMVQRHLLITVYSVTLIALALGGLFVKRLYSLYALTLIIIVYVYSPVIFATNMVTLWDRWLYFLGLPLTLFAMLSIQTIIEYKLFAKISILFKTIIAAALILTFTYPIFNFLNIDKSVIPEYYSQELSGFIPSNMVWNAIGRPYDKDMKDSAQALRNNYVPGTTIYTEWREKGLGDYYLRDFGGALVSVENGTKPQKPYFVWCFNYNNLPIDYMYDGASEVCPVFSYGVVQVEQQ